MVKRSNQSRLWRKSRYMSVLGFVVLVGCAINPQEIGKEELLELIQADSQLIAESQLRIDEPLSLGDIMARAVLTNLDQKVSNLEEALALGAFELSRYDMLPSAALSSTYYDRNNEYASRSISVLSRRETLEPSTSQESEHLYSDLRLSWNLLDFGVSYYQAKQEADRYLISGANRSKAFIDLLQQARSTYWRALAAQRLRDSVADIIDEANTAYAEVNQGIEERIYPNMLQAMLVKKELFTLIRNLERLQSDLEQSMIMLANFINVPSDTRLVLVEPDELPEMPNIGVSIDNLELTALMNSSEVLVEAYNARIEHAETRKALLRLLPGVEIGDSQSYDSNDFLYNNDWNEASIRVSWNLLRLASTRQTMRSSELRKELQTQRRLAANMAVVTRLNLSLHQYATLLNQLEKARELRQIDAEIAELTSNAVSSDADSQLNLVRTRTEAITAELSYLMAYAQVQGAYGAVLVSLGLNPIPPNYDGRSLEELSVLLSEVINQWNEGDLPLFDAPITTDISTAGGNRITDATADSNPGGDSLFISDLAFTGNTVTDDGTTLTIDGTYGSLAVTKATSAYTYTLDDSRPATQALDENDMSVDSFAYTLLDADGGTYTATLDITVTRELRQIDAEIAALTSNAVSSVADSRVNLVRTQSEAITTELNY